MTSSDDKPLSSSHVQQAAERLILSGFAAQEGISDLSKPTPRAIPLSSGAKVEVDGCTPDRRVVVEAYARQGTLKGAQLKKISQDILKLALLLQEPEWTGARAVIAFASQEAHDSVKGWVLEAAKSFKIELVVVRDLPDELRASILAAQRRQVMVNLSDYTGDVASEDS